VPVVVLDKGAPASAHTDLEFLVFLRTCFRAGAYSVKGHSCCHNHIGLKFNNQQSVLHVLACVRRKPLFQPKVVASVAVGEELVEVRAFGQLPYGGLELAPVPCEHGCVHKVDEQHRDLVVPHAYKGFKCHVHIGYVFMGWYYAAFIR